MENKQSPAKALAIRTMSNLRTYLPLLALALVLALVSAPSFAQSGTLTVDTAAFIDQINNWLPMALQIVGIGVGIAGAFALAGMVGTMIINAFKGRFGS